MTPEQLVLVRLTSITVNKIQKGLLVSVLFAIKIY